jgi:hypothetical protein
MVKPPKEFKCTQADSDREEYTSPNYQNLILVHERGEGWYFSQIDEDTGRRLSGFVLICKNPTEAIRTIKRQ